MFGHQLLVSRPCGTATSASEQRGLFQCSMWSAGDRFVKPSHKPIQDLQPNFRVRAPAARPDVEGVIAIIHQHQGRTPAQSRYNRFEQAGVGKRIARPLQEQHRNVHIRQVLRPLFGWSPSGVEWKAEEDQSFDTRQR